MRTHSKSLLTNFPEIIARKISLMRKQNIKIGLQFAKIAKKHLLWSIKDGDKKLAKYIIKAIKQK